MEYGCSEIVVQSTQVSQPSALSPRDADAWNTSFNTGRTTTAGIKFNHRNAIGSPPFWRGVNLIANGVAGLPVDVFKRDGDDKEVAKQHSAQKLLKRKASPIMHARRLRQTMQRQSLIFGNSFAWIDRNNRMQPDELWLLDPQQMIIRFVDNELWYSTVIDGEQVKFPGRDILHIPNLTHDGIKGYSSLDIFAEAMGVGIAAQQFGSRFFGNGANTSGILMVPGFFPDDKIRNTMDAWKNMNEGLENAHKVALLQEGVKFQPFNVPPDSAQFLETREFEIKMVADILGLPGHLLGSDARTSHNSLEQENQSFLRHSLAPWLDTWEDELEMKLLSDREQERDTHFIEFNRAASIQMMFLDQIEAIHKQVEMGLLTVNEGRAKLNEPNVGEDGDKRYHPANWVAIGEEPEPVDNTPVDEDNSDDDNEEEVEEEDAGARAVLRQMLTSSVSDALQFEKRKVVTAATSQANFCGWVDTFYSDWSVREVPALKNTAAAALKSKHAQESKRQLFDVAGSSTLATLPDNIKELVSAWDEREATLTTDLLETII